MWPRNDKSGESIDQRREVVLPRHEPKPSLRCGSNVKPKAAVAIRGALGTARPTLVLDSFKGMELSNAKVGAVSHKR